MGPTRENRTRALRDEGELVEAARAGDVTALRQLYEQHVERVYALAFRLTGGADLAKDVTQEAFVRAWQRLDQFRGDARFATWMHTITVSTGLNVIRKADRHRKRECSLESGHAVAVSGPRQADPDLRDRLKAAVDALPDIYRVVFVMHDVEGYSHSEIAEALEVAEGTSKARLSRARGRLREKLRDFAPEYVG